MRIHKAAFFAVLLSAGGLGVSVIWARGVAAPCVLQDSPSRSETSSFVERPAVAEWIADFHDVSDVGPQVLFDGCTPSDESLREWEESSEASRPEDHPPL